MIWSMYVQHLYVCIYVLTATIRTRNRENLCESCMRKGKQKLVRAHKYVCTYICTSFRDLGVNTKGRKLSYAICTWSYDEMFLFSNHLVSIVSINPLLKTPLPPHPHSFAFQLQFFCFNLEIGPMETKVLRSSG
jgi:hypothetical protein